MGDVVKFRRTRKSGDLYEVILPLTVYLYAADGEGAAGLALLELQKRLHGLQYNVDDWLVRIADMPHHKAQLRVQEI